jgi:signal transduction histidine kinase
MVVQRERLVLDHQHYTELTQLNNELVNLQRDLTKKNLELHRLSEQRNEFVGWVAHDLRNPLTAILGFSELLAEDLQGRITADELGLIEKIRGLSHFMLGLVNDTLSLAQIESGKLSLHLVKVDVGALLAHNVALHAPFAERKSIRLVLEQVLNNLIGNALKFSRESTVTRVGMKVEDAAVVISVADGGQGIPAAEREKLFLPFQKTSVRSTKGEQSTGLGLTIAKKIVEGHGGRIWLESEVGRGTTFFVRLPTDLRADGAPP